MGYFFQHRFEEKSWAGAMDAPPGAGELLAGAGLRWEGPSDLTLVFWDDAGPAATASFRNKIIKGVAVRPDLRGTGTGRDIVGRAIARQRLRGIVHTIVYTSPEASPFFRVMGFREVSRAEPWSVLLEAGFGSFDRYLSRFRKIVPPEAVAAVTHENLSPQQIRAFLSLAGSKPAVLILAGAPAVQSPPPGLLCHEGEDYFRPCSLFPSYYIEDAAAAPRAWALLQARLFIKAAAALSLSGVVLMPGAETYNSRARPLFREAGLPCLEANTL